MIIEEKEVYLSVDELMMQVEERSLGHMTVPPHGHAA